jgi:AcrR family transcriptional regulator/predicted DNA-binding transcriptional regulator AlpA
MQIKEQLQAMGIEEIAQRSGFTKDLIYRLTRMGLLPRPSKIGFQESLYNEEHLDRLKKIRELREEKKMSFSKIKTILRVEESPENDRQAYSQTKKEQIMDKALEMFSKNGFANTKISEITDELGVAKGTFYLYFKSKKELFVECISRMTSIVLPEEVWDEIRKENDFIKRQRIKLKAFLKTFPSFSGVLSLLRLSLRSEDATISTKAKDTYRTLAEPVTRDLKKAVEAGVVRDVNVDVVSLLLLGMAESLGSMLMVESTCTSDEGAEVLLDFMAKGLLREDSARMKSKVRWNAKDLKGLTIVLDNLQFGENDYLPATLGEGQLDLTVDNVKSICIEEGGGLYLAHVTHQDGETITVSINGDLLVSGHSKLGAYSLTIKKLSELLSFSE